MTTECGGPQERPQEHAPEVAGSIPAPAPSRTRPDSPHGNSAQAGGTTPTRERHCSSPPANSAKPEPTEKEFQAQVIALAQLTGHKVAHFRPARTTDGDWRTPVAADGAGFPDLVIVGRGKVIFAELKAEAGTATTLQVDWLEQIRAAGGQAYLWKPSDWNDIEDVLSRRSARST